MFEPETPHVQQARELLQRDQERALILQALALVLSSPDHTGQVLLVIDHGRLQTVKPQPSLRNNADAHQWLRRTNSTPFE